jgi:hypothetical protein
LVKNKKNAGVPVRRKDQPQREKHPCESAHDAGHRMGVKQLEQQGTDHNARQTNLDQQPKQRTIDVVAKRDHAQPVHQQQHRYRNSCCLRHHHRHRQRHHGHRREPRPAPWPLFLMPSKTTAGAPTR